MKLVIDANILFAAIIKDGLTRRILLDEQYQFYLPAFVSEELQEHLHEIQQKSGIGSPALEKTILSLLEHIVKVPDQEFADILKDIIFIDRDDVQYIALAMKLQCPLWSNDRELKNQQYVRVLTTAELKELLGL